MTATNIIPRRAEIPAAKTESASQHLNLVDTLKTLGALPGTAHLTSREAALHIGTTPEVLRVWRSTGKGPRFRGRGHFVRYLKSDLDDFMSGYDYRFDRSSAGFSVPKESV